MITKPLLKKCFVILMFLGIIGLTNLNAQTTFSIGDFNYMINDDGETVTITGFSDEAYVNGITELNLPSSIIYNGIDYPITIIGEGAFYRCSNLTGSLIIPNSVKKIDYNAFRGCDGFSGLFIPQSVEVLNGNPFEFSGPSSIVVDPNNMHYDSRNDCNAIVETNTNILIKGCQNTIIPSTVTSIGGWAFSGCKDMITISIPNSITSIGQAAFGYCDHMTSIYIPNSVDTIGVYAFYACSSLEQIIVDAGNSYYDSRNNCNAIMRSSSNELIAGCKNTIIPNNTYSICNGAFWNCTGLTGSLILPNSVKIIGDLAFNNCRNITSLQLSDSINYIGYAAFEGCRSISGSLLMPNTISYIGERAFSGCWELNVVSFPNSLDSIGERAFTGCNLTSIYIPCSVIFIGEAAFSGCDGLESIIVDTANIVYDSRYNCNAIIKTSTNELIAGCDNTITPNNVLSIGAGAFAYCTGLIDTLVLPNSIQTIKEQAFYHTNNWWNGRLTIPSSVIAIEEFAFGNCYNINEVKSQSIVPPLLDGEFVFGLVGYHNPLIVPCNSLDQYYHSSWNKYFNTMIQDCIGVAEIDANFASVYPNPTTSIVKIEAENIQNVSIYNMLGEMVFESAASGNEVEYDFSNNESGVYLVRVKTAQGVVTKRVTVM